ncbi:GNAT family N-acetyltransferase [Flavobacteriaceae bacterium 3-367]|uniref:GNAT family N-acetyltransferase n=1 Tax=Eudoraea algarum TaxID=3417568 RepID=UPI0032821CA0
MSNSISIVPLSPKTLDVYVRVGRKAYEQHYLDVWENRDASSYVQSSFSVKAVGDDLKNGKNGLFVIYLEKTPVGVLKIVVDQPVASFGAKEALLLEKIYLLREHAGKGIGKTVIQFVVEHAGQLGKKAIWLDVMDSSPAFRFYLKNGFVEVGRKNLDLPGIKQNESGMHILMRTL